MVDPGIIGLVAIIVAVVLAVGALSVSNLFQQWRRNRNQTLPGPARHKKKITLSPKQILGLDDDTYLRRLPHDELSRNAHPITVHPFRQESDSQSSKRDHEQIKYCKEQGVNPWHVEFEPNPIIFAHLAPRTPRLQPQLPAYAESSNEVRPEESETVPASSIVDTLSSIDNAISSISVLDSGSSQTSEDGRSIEDVTKKPENVPHEQVPQGQQCMNDNGEGASNRYNILYGDRNDFLEVFTVSNFATALPFREGGDANVEENSLHTIPAMPSAPEPALTSRDMAGGAKLPFKCPICSRTHEKPGELSNHYNRAHDRRYACELCNNRVFGLAADLKRHKKSVHRQHLDSDETYQCTIPGCSTPNKLFLRKDNFNRHVKVCRRRIGKGKAEERAEHEAKEE